MRRLRALVIRMRSLFARARWGRDLDDELAAHVEMHTLDNIRAGMTSEEARRAALVRLGGLEQTKEIIRDRQRAPFVDTLIQDGRLALRLMRHSPGLTTAVLVVLALGIGANTVMFSVVHAVLLQPLPYPDPSRLQLVRQIGESGQPQPAAPPDYYLWRDSARTFESLAAFYLRPFDVTGEGEPERIGALIVSSEFLKTLGIVPALGRDLEPADERWGNHRVVVLTDGFWRRRFGADPAIVGRPVVLNAEPYTVVGVLSGSRRSSLAWTAQFSFQGTDAQALVPMAFAPGDNRNSHNNYSLAMFGRLRSQVPPAAATADLDRLNDQITAGFPDNGGTRMEVRPLQGALVEDVRRGLLVLLGAVVFVLLIACADLANLLLARAAVRRREMAVRVAIGASRARILRQLLTESVMLAACGSGLALLLARLSLGAVNALGPDVLPRNEDITLDGVVLAYTALLSIATGIAFGLAPAWRSVDVSPGEALHEGGRAGADRRGHRVRATLVAAEIAMSLVLLVGAGLMLKTLRRLAQVDAGFDARDILTVQVSIPRHRYVDADLERRFSPAAYAKSARFFDEVLERVRGIPGVEDTGAINGLPLMGEIWGKTLTLYDRPIPATLRELPPIQYRVVAGNYFRALRVPVLRGRALTESDTAEAAPVAVVNAEMVKRHWNGQDPIGKIIAVNPPIHLLPAGAVPPEYQPARLTVVGVVADVHYDSLRAAALPVVYLPFAQGSEGTTTMYLAVRASGPAAGLPAAIRAAVREVDHDVPISSVLTMEDRVSSSLAQPWLQTLVLGAFALLAVVLAGVGTYGVMSYTTRQRTREIGIRMAIGATSRAILALLLRRSAVVIMAGVLAGLAGALPVARPADASVRCDGERSRRLSVSDGDACSSRRGRRGCRRGVRQGSSPWRRCARIDARLDPNRSRRVR
jgi:putative ABC transport system permease protein